MWRRHLGYDYMLLLWVLFGPTLIPARQLMRLLQAASCFPPQADVARLRCHMQAVNVQSAQAYLRLCDDLVQTVALA